MLFLTGVIKNGKELNFINTNELFNNEGLVLEIYDNSTFSSIRIAFDDLDKSQEIIGVHSNYYYKDRYYLYACNIGLIKILNYIEILDVTYYEDSDEFIEDELDSIPVCSYIIGETRFSDLKYLSKLESVYLVLENFYDTLAEDFYDDAFLAVIENSSNFGDYEEYGCLAVSVGVLDKDAFKNTLIKYCMFNK